MSPQDGGEPARLALADELRGQEEDEERRAADSAAAADAARRAADDAAAAAARKRDEEDAEEDRLEVGGSVPGGGSTHMVADAYLDVVCLDGSCCTWRPAHA